MTLLDFRDGVLQLKGLVTDPGDKRALEEALKNVAMYRMVGPVDADTMARLRAKYLEPG